METEDKLYELIHTLDKSEKGFVKKLATLYSKEEANGARLFDIYNNVKEYDKKKIDQLVQKEKFANRVAVTKHYLYELILRGLKSYYSEKKDLYILKTQIQYAEILKDKGLYKQAFTIVKKAKKIGLHNEIYFPLIELIAIERAMFRVYDANPNELELLAKLSVEEEKKYKYLIEGILFFEKTCFQVTKFAHDMGREERIVIIDKFDQILNSDEYQNYLYLSSKKIKLLHQNVVVFNHFIRQEEIAFEREGQTLLNMAMDKKQSHPLNPRWIIQFVNNFAVAAAQFHNLELFVKCIESLEDLKKEIDDSRDFIYQLAETCLINLNCIYFFLSGDFKSGLKDSKLHLQKEMLNINAITDSMASTYLNKSIFHFLLGEYHDAIKALNAIELYTEQHTTPYVDSECYLIKILSHIELGNTEIALYLTKLYKALLEKESLAFQQRKILVDTIIENPWAEKNTIAEKTFLLIKEKNIATDACFGEILINVFLWCDCVCNKKSFTLEYQSQSAKKITYTSIEV